MAMTPKTTPLDIAAWTLSAACLGHCLALPVVMSVYPLLHTAGDAEWVHWAFFALAAPISFLALAPTGASVLARSVAGLGLLLLAMGAAGLPSHESETALSVTGALALAAAHVLNVRSRRGACASDCSIPHAR
jgi:hypothetical protein